jgi:hypothetical protein
MINYMEYEAISFDRFFNKIDSIPINNNIIHNHQNVSLKFEANLVHLGYPPLIILPDISLYNQPNMSCAFRALATRCPVSRDFSKLSKPRLTQDSNIEKLITKYDVDIVMTNSAFISLVYHLNKENFDDLKMPIIVKNVKKDTG